MLLLSVLLTFNYFKVYVLLTRHRHYALFAISDFVNRNGACQKLILLTINKSLSMYVILINNVKMVLACEGQTSNHFNLYKYLQSSLLS